MAPPGAGLETQASIPVLDASVPKCNVQGVHWVHHLETHAPEALFGSLVLGGLLSVPAAISPAIAVDESPGGPEWRGLGALGDGIVEDPLDGLVELLQALVEQAEVTERGRVGEHLAGLWRGGRGRGSCDGRVQLIVGAGRLEAVLLAYDTVRFAHVRREELVQPNFHRH